jgi:hypothetical protein
MPGENSGNMYRKPASVDNETARETRRATVANPVQPVVAVKETSSSDWSSYRSGERDSRPAPPPPPPPKSNTQNTDWVDYRSGERGDPIQNVANNPPVVEVLSFGGFVPSASISPIPPLPVVPPVPVPTTYKVKTATPEIILFDDDSVPVEVLSDLIFENIGGQELLSLSRHDIISGDYVPNQLIKNLTSLKQESSSKRLLSLQNTSDRYFSNFGIKLENKIPFVGNGPNGSNVYLDSSQNIIIELINLDIDEQVEVQLSIGGTIYNIVLGASES